MILFRSFVVGLLGACIWILATRPTTIVVRPPPTTMARFDVPVFEVPNLSGIRGLPAAPGPTVVDVAPNVSASRLPSLIQLGEGEHVIAVNDQPAASDLDAGRLLAQVSAYPQRYIDLEVAGPVGERRVLVLLH